MSKGFQIQVFTTCESLGLKMKALVQRSIMLRTKYQNWYQNFRQPGYPWLKMFDSRGRPIDISKFKIFQNHDEHKKYQKPKEPNPKSNSLLSLQPLRLQNTDTYSDMAKTLSLYNWWKRKGQREKMFNLFELKIYRTFIIISTTGSLKFDFSWAQY